MSSIKIKSDDGNYWVSVQDGNNQVLSNTGTETNALQFEWILPNGWGNGSPKVQFKNGNNYIALNGEQLILSPNNAASFDVLWRGVGGVAIKAPNGKFVSRDTLGSNNVQASRNVVGPWESFNFIEV